MASSTAKPLRVLISGGGIAGPALAFWLNKLGHSCTVVERFRSLRANGQQIDLRKQGVEAAERMGLLDDIRDICVDEAGIQFVYSSDKRFAYFPKFEMKKPGEGKGAQGFSSEFEIMRGDLCRLLYDKTKHDTAYRFGLNITDFFNETDHVKVTLSDGSVEAYDMLVAADGQGSRIRKMLLADEPASADRSRDFGLYTALFTIPRRPGDTNIATVYVAAKRRNILTRFHSEAEGQCYFSTMLHTNEIRQALKQDVSEQKKLFADIFRDAGWRSDQFIKDMFESDDFYVQPFIQIRSDIWSKGRVVCLGDAGYGPTALTGMGTSLALIGAHILAGEISQSPHDLGKAFAAYETVFRPYVEEIQQIPRALPGLAYPQSWGVKILQLVLRTACLLRVEKLIQVGFKEKEKWKIPEYPRLKAGNGGKQNTTSS